MNRIKIFEQYMERHGLSVPAEVVTVLDGMGYFTLPASISHHGAEEGGLFDHSLAVAEELVELTRYLSLSWSRPESPVLVGLFHDLCKLDDYKQEVTDPGTVMFGEEEPVGRVFEFTRRPTAEQMDSGHGGKSVQIVAGLGLPLTAEEVACIRWHMGAFDARDNWQYYTAAIHRFQNVLWTHTADMIAAHILFK